MSFSIHAASAPVFVNSLRDMRAWLDKALATRSESELMEARLAPDMRPLPAQFQMASDSAKNAMARLAGIEAPSMPDTEASFDELQARIAATVAFLESVPRDAIDGREDADVELKTPTRSFQFKGRGYLLGFALPNFYFHVSMAYAILRNQGVPLGKPDYLQHLGAPIQL